MPRIVNNCSFTSPLEVVTSKLTLSLTLRSQFIGEDVTDQDAFAVICFDKFSSEHSITKGLVRCRVRINAQDLYTFRFVAEG